MAGVFGRHRWLRSRVNRLDERAQLPRRGVVILGYLDLFPVPVPADEKIVPSRFDPLAQLDHAVRADEFRAVTPPARPPPHVNQGRVHAVVELQKRHGHVVR